MAKKPVALSQKPVIIRGSHSTRTEYPDGTVEFETHWDELVRDVRDALARHEGNVPTEAVAVSENIPKRKRKNVSKETG